MSSADELLARVEEAAKHPKALLFGALAAECRTPTQTASEARQNLGLSNEEEKLAKAVAVLKRDSQALFGRSYLEVLAEIVEKVRKEKMEVEVQNILIRDTKSGGFIRGLLEEVLGGHPQVTTTPKIEHTRNAAFQVVNDPDHTTSICPVSIVPLEGSFCVWDRFSDIAIYIPQAVNHANDFRETVLGLAKEFAESYQERTKRKATIYTHEW